jgi:hypothetical protein
VKPLPKYSVFFLSILFILVGVFIKQQMGFEGQNLPGVVAGVQTNMVGTLYPDIPIYPNSIIASILEKNNTVVVSLESKDGPDKIMEYYQNFLLESNWSGGPVSFIKGDKKLSVAVTQNQTENQTAIVLNYSFVPTK